MKDKYIIMLLLAVIVVLICIIVWPSEQVQDNSGENEIYRNQIGLLLEENDNLKGYAYRLQQRIDSLNTIKTKIHEDNKTRHKRIDSIPNDSLDIVLHRMLDSLSAELNP